MNPAEQLNRKREAQSRLAAQRRRVGILRSRAIATSLICFALLWAIVFVQMATGNDPVLGEGRRVAGATAARPGREDANGAGAEVIEPEPAEPEVIEPEPVEAEVIEPEAELAPVETAQS